jgi:hypothetical protein
MSYEPKLQRNASAKIAAYLADRYTTREAYLVAVEEIRLALLNLAANPRQGTAPPGLFENRPIFRFSLHADGVRRDVQVCFCYDQDDPGERTILISDFMPVSH